MNGALMASSVCSERDFESDQVVSCLTYQQKRCPLPQSTAGALSKGKLNESEAPGLGRVNRTALSHLATGHQRMAGLLSTKA